MFDRLLIQQTAQCERDEACLILLDLTQVAVHLADDKMQITCFGHPTWKAREDTIRDRLSASSSSPGTCDWQARAAMSQALMKVAAGKPR
jgi:hypothetical protein